MQQKRDNSRTGTGSGHPSGWGRVLVVSAALVLVMLLSGGCGKVLPSWLSKPLDGLVPDWLSDILPWEDNAPAADGASGGSSTKTGMGGSGTDTPDEGETPGSTSDRKGEGTSDNAADADGEASWYAYGQLSDGEKTIYQEILEGLRSWQEIPVSTRDQEELDRIYADVMADHPEIFYVSGYTYTTHTMNGKVTSLSFRGNYTCSRKEAASFQPAIDAYAAAAMEGIPAGADDYTVVRHLYEYIIRHTDYDNDADNNQNILSVFLGGKSVCNGYAKALQYLLQQAHIPAELVTGTTRGQGHAWDLVQADGDWYYVDPTWGDSQFADAAAGSREWVNYDYLLVTTGDILTTHTITGGTAMPECSARADNYYVREGAWFDTWDTGALQDAFTEEESEADWDSVLRLRCGTEEVYEEMLQDLIEGQGIYQYLGGQDTIQYTKSDELHTLTILL